MQSGTLFKRGDIYWTRIAGKRVSTGCRDRKAALAVRAELERKAANPRQARQESALTVDVLAAHCDARSTEGAKPATLDFLEDKCKALALRLPSHARHIDRAAVQKYTRDRLVEGITRATVKKERVVLKAALKRARLDGTWDGQVDEVFDHFDAPYEPCERFLTPFEVWAIAWALERNRLVYDEGKRSAEARRAKQGKPPKPWTPAPNRAAHFVFLVATGCRWSESVRARRSDWQDGWLTVRGTKTKKAATKIPIVGVFRTLLEWSLERAGEDVLFAHWGGAANEIKHAAQRMGLDHVSPNDLRRTKATWLRSADVPIDLIAASLRNSPAVAAGTYARNAPEAHKARLEERLGGYPNNVLFLYRQPEDPRRNPANLRNGPAFQNRPEIAKSPGNLVGHDRLELSANGLRGLLNDDGTPEKQVRTGYGVSKIDRWTDAVASLGLVPHVAALLGGLVEFATQV